MITLKAQAVLTANALRNLANSLPEASNVLKSVLHSHADDLLRAVSTETSQ